VTFGNKLIAEIPHLRRFARSLTRNADQADDLVQSVLERALAREHLLRKPGSLRSWLFRILYNSHLNACKRASAQEVPTDFTESAHLAPSVAANQEQRIEVIEVLSALDRLPLEQRAAITMTAIEGLSYDEAAKVLDIPMGTLMSRIYRGRQALRGISESDAPKAQLRATLRLVE
jgi:RNA polymerase sigma-70 factor (ECF subfamily)